MIFDVPPTHIVNLRSELKKVDALLQGLLERPAPRFSDDKLQALTYEVMNYPFKFYNFVWLDVSISIVYNSHHVNDRGEYVRGSSKDKYYHVHSVNFCPSFVRRNKAHEKFYNFQDNFGCFSELDSAVEFYYRFVSAFLDKINLELNRGMEIF